MFFSIQITSSAANSSSSSTFISPSLSCSWVASSASSPSLLRSRCQTASKSSLMSFLPSWNAINWWLKVEILTLLPDWTRPQQCQEEDNRLSRPTLCSISWQSLLSAPPLPLSQQMFEAEDVLLNSINLPEVGQLTLAALKPKKHLNKNYWMTKNHNNNVWSQNVNASCPCPMILQY